MACIFPPCSHNGCMANTYVTLRVDTGTRNRLSTLANTYGRSMSDVIRTLSYARSGELLTLTAVRAVSEERREGDEVTALSDARGGRR